MSHFCQRLSHHCVPNLLTWVLGEMSISEVNDVTEELPKEFKEHDVTEVLPKELG